MRTPIPLNGHPVRATLVTQQEEAFVDDDEELDDDELDDDEDDEELDDEEQDDDATPEEKDAREVASDSAPWSPTPLRPARDFVKHDKNAGIEINFPTVYEEDRSKKLQDLATAQAVGAITHQRMSEQIAKELGFEQYNYDEELENIKIEMKKLPPGILSSTGEIAGAGGGDGAAGASDSGFADQPPRRADLSGDAAQAFRIQQRSTVSASESSKLLRHVLMMRRDFLSALQEMRAFRESAMREVTTLRESASRDIA